MVGCVIWGSVPRPPRFGERSGARCAEEELVGDADVRGSLALAMISQIMIDGEGICSRRLKCGLHVMSVLLRSLWLLAASPLLHG